MVVGIITGLLGARFGRRILLSTVILAAIAFPLTFEGILFIPWKSTITYHVGGTLVTSTMNHFQHPDLVAYAAANYTVSRTKSGLSSYAALSTPFVAFQEGR